MKTSTKQSLKSGTNGWMSALLIAAGLALGVMSVQADQPTHVLRPGGTLHGKTYSQWSAAWWQWVTAIPAASNPLVDQTGQNAALGQSGKVWFLAGNLGGVSERTITVPANKALFFPILNTIYLGFPCDDRNLPGCEVDQALEQANDVRTLLSFITPSMDGATLSCKIDGIPVRDLPAHRVQSSTLYSLALPEQNVFGLPPGAYHPCVDDGYFLALAPLQAGRHTIHFAAVNSDGSFGLDVTYHLTVRENGHEHD